MRLTTPQRCGTLRVARRLRVRLRMNMRRTQNHSIQRRRWLKVSIGRMAQRRCQVRVQALIAGLCQGSSPSVCIGSR
jgi:hypothetical protein